MLTVVLVLFNYDLGPGVVTKNCVFDYKFDAVIPPTILDGGKNLLLANFHGPRSLKCDSNDGGLANQHQSIHMLWYQETFCVIVNWT